MSINELEMKCRELRQLQALIDEAQAEAELRLLLYEGPAPPLRSVLYAGPGAAAARPSVKPRPPVFDCLRAAGPRGTRPWHP